MCGDTQIPVTDLRQAIVRLIQKDEQNEGKTGLDQQFEVWTNNYHNLSSQLKWVANRWSCIYCFIKGIGTSVTQATRDCQKSCSHAF